MPRPFTYLDAALPTVARCLHETARRVDALVSDQFWEGRDQARTRRIVIGRKCVLQNKRQQTRLPLTESIGATYSQV
jgi:hypothetical protein